MAESELPELEGSGLFSLVLFAPRLFVFLNTANVYWTGSLVGLCKPSVIVMVLNPSDST